MAAKRLAILAVTILAACGGESRDSIAADSLSRDLQLAPVDSSAELGDYAAAAPAKPVAPKPKPAAKPRPRPAPAPAPAPEPAPEPLALASGTVIPTAVDQEINSRINKKGEIVTTTVSSDVSDSRGRVIIPAGSKVTMTITEIRESENKGDKTGKLTLTPTEVAIGGRSYPVMASAEALDRQLKDRKTNAGDVAKVGAGAAIGALAGRLIGGNTKGAVIGGVIGGAVGTQRAVETQDRDVVVPAGSRVELTLQTGLTI
jgi:type IV secretory pathway VirB10-like protein